jgi:ACS family hexuronate transporter-like MFS transporter|tara:strand:+ start:3286 stop:4533 length:1248 start_codon:yes stop_codon:yes gene_type:complete
LKEQTVGWWRQRKWQIAALLCLITTINYMDRLALSIAAPTLTKLFSLSSIDYGDISAGFLVAYALGQLLGGPLIDKVGVHKALSFAVMLWSIAGMAHAFAQGFRSLLSVRFLLGIGESANFPAANKAIAEWFPPNERSLAVGIVTAGTGLGSIIAPPLLVWLIIQFGWQWAFIVPGLLGFIWLLAWHKIYSSPKVSESQQNEQPDQGIGDSFSYRHLFRQPSLWGLMLSRFVSDGAFYFVVFWLPLYLTSERGLDLRVIAMFAWIPFVAADLGAVGGGWAGKALIDRGFSVNTARKILIWSGAIMAVGISQAAALETTTALIGLICVSMFAIQLKNVNLFSLPADLYPSSKVATVWGLFGAAGSLGGALFQSAVGRIVEHGSYELVFYIAAVMHVLSAMIVMLFIPRIESPKCIN